MRRVSSSFSASSLDHPVVVRVVLEAAAGVDAAGDPSRFSSRMKWRVELTWSSKPSFGPLARLA